MSLRSEGAYGTRQPKGNTKMVFFHAADISEPTTMTYKQHELATNYGTKELTPISFWMTRHQTKRDEQTDVGSLR